MKTTLLKEIFTILSILFTVLSCSQTKNELYSKQVLPALPYEGVSKFGAENDSIRIDEYRILTAKGKSEYIKVLKTFDWFNEKSEVKKKEIINTIENDLEANYSFLALEDLSFDAEGFETAESYKNLLNEMIKIAEVENQIKKINVTKERNLINISILTNKNEELKYAVDINENQDWIDTNFIEQFINGQLLSKTNNRKIFIALPAIDQIANITFISQSDFEKAKKNGLIPSDDIFLE
ncbi:hypothetical protein [Chryseobacterium caseinilyticum]|uniref:Uncharacterized protein n=1 Tax=Chryseobacterium caseinilyticum TaxID=2771428 RepID=A0ABR8ZIL9_9FLAO|nr:hypothetical protein [Chryseobacterium caseinilyticum]MBD8084658.1 hypothetical protein [Chryseobacterium caseinilyticum]